ncbi:MAG: ComF family protein, partial [Bacteroidales bacterium]|nr:ComF family protein [Bacteroidales bacterium]
LFKHEMVICLRCKLHLPVTHYLQVSDNPAAKVFWGRVEMTHCFTYLHYKKGNATQKLIHQLKYRGRKDAGIFLGEAFGKYIKSVHPGQMFDCLVPVPLHPDKQRSRGYNQSAVIATGLSEKLNIPVLEHVLIRNKRTATQTKKTRYNRWENVEGIFAVTDSAKISGKHIAIIDDVITTGSTIESCCMALRKSADVCISALAIGSSR